MIIIFKVRIEQNHRHRLLLLWFEYKMRLIYWTSHSQFGDQLLREAGELLVLWASLLAGLDCWGWAWEVMTALVPAKHSGSRFSKMWTSHAVRSQRCWRSCFLHHAYHASKRLSSWHSDTVIRINWTRSEQHSTQVNLGRLIPLFHSSRLTTSIHWESIYPDS